MYKKGERASGGDAGEDDEEFAFYFEQKLATIDCLGLPDMFSN